MILGIALNKIGNEKQQRTADENTRLVENKCETDHVRLCYGNCWPQDLLNHTCQFKARLLSECFKNKDVCESVRDQGFFSKQKKIINTG